MKQYDAVESISKAIIAENLIDAIFLKGSLARSSEDEFSNIDLYCIVADSYFDLFIDGQLGLLATYDKIVFSKSRLQGHHQTICIYSNGVILNLNTIKLEQLTEEDDVAVIHDPKGLLSNYQKKIQTYNPKEVGSLIDDYLLLSLEFYSAYQRKDTLYSFWLINNLFYELGTLLRIKYDSEYAKLGLKQFELVDKIRDDYYEIAARLRITSILEAAKMIYVLFDKYINNIPLLFAEYINFDFYQFVRRIIMSIN